MGPTRLSAVMESGSPPPPAAGKGLVEAAHFCYLVAHVPFGHYTVKTDHLVLLGSSHSQEFLKFATTEAIHRTEIFEYCQMLGSPKSFISSFQVYKLLYASRLADYGLVSQALLYCEAIGTALLSQGESSHPVLLVELIKLAEKLKMSDPLALERRRGDTDLEPSWLVRLRRRQQELEVGEQMVAGDIGDPRSAHSDILGARGPTTENTFYQDLLGHQGYSEPLGHRSAFWPVPDQTVLSQPSSQQPFPPQLGSRPIGGGAGQTGAPGPLHSVPDAHLPGTGSGVAVAAAPGGRVWEETMQAYPPLGENTMSQETFQHPDGQKIISIPQVTLIPRAQNMSESSVKEDEEGSSDGTDKNPPQNSEQREKLEDVKENAKSSGFGWLSWFRSKPTSNVSPTGEEDSSDSPDSEETSRTPPRQTSPSLSLTPPPGAQALHVASPFSRNTGGGDGQGSVSGAGEAEGIGIGGLTVPEGASSGLYSSPEVLLPPPPLKGAVPLYNPSQVLQLSTATSLSRPNRLAQRRYPTQR